VGRYTFSKAIDGSVATTVLPVVKVVLKGMKALPLMS
jgi:hypothetical protein